MSVVDALCREREFLSTAGSSSVQCWRRRAFLFFDADFLIHSLADSVSMAVQTAVCSTYALAAAVPMAVKKLCARFSVLVHLA